MRLAGNTHFKYGTQIDLGDTYKLYVARTNLYALCLKKVAHHTLQNIFVQG